MRDLAATPPPYAGRGRQPQVPFGRVDRWAATLPETAWQTVEVRDGEKGPLAVQMARTLVQARDAGRASEGAEWLVVFREQQGDGSWKRDYLLSNAAITTTAAEFARVYKAEHRIEESLKRAKSEAGLADYQVRTWEGWHHHQTLSLIATWFLSQETRRGKNPDRRIDRAAGASSDQPTVTAEVGMRSPGTDSAGHAASVVPQRGGKVLSLETTQPLAATTL